MAKGGQASDWIGRAADEVEARVDARKGRRATVVCASGISPSGPIHLGNLREVMTTHLVAEELRRRGRVVDHLHSWDDYDRLRKVPAGVPEHFAEHIGRPISQVPDPGGEYPSWADRYIDEFQTAVAKMGIEPRWVRQSVNYPAGLYREGIVTAMNRRLEIFEVLAKYQTESRQEVPLDERRAAYWPLSVYCTGCGHDHTTVTSWNPATTQVGYTCDRCGPRDFLLSEECPAKLVWKVDWPMRWAFEGVDFEPGGEDHSSPGSSYTVGQEIVAAIYGGLAPNYVGYGFVGMSGRTKISSSAGSNATPEFALRFVEPAILRWLYIRRRPDKKFTIDFGSEIWRAYDEFDAFRAKATAAAADQGDEALEYARCVQTSAGGIPTPAIVAPFRVVSTAADMTNGHVGQILRIVRDHLDEAPTDDAALAADLQPRLDCAIGWATHCLPDDERLTVRDAHDPAAWAALSDEQRGAVALLVEKLPEFWSLKGLTTLVYGVPKLVSGLPLDAPPTAELKAFQRQVFIALYQLVLGKETGPRLPTLFLSLGRARITELLAPPT